MLSHFPRLLIATLIGVTAIVSPGFAQGWKAGTATADITPATPMWMSGYQRDRPTVHRTSALWAKALALEDSSGRRLVLLTADLCGITAAVSGTIADELARSHSLERSRILINVSHNHSGPVIEGYLPANEIPDSDRAMVAGYRREFEQTMVRLAREAISQLQPVHLNRGRGWTTFGVNRRNNAEADVPALRAAGRLRGPVDPDVPVLRITDPAGRLMAIVFGYACHPTVLQESAWNGDYSGYAQAVLEDRHPGATAHFFAGAGADTNPLPRKTIELARKYGTQLADTVDEVLRAPMHPVAAVGEAAYAEISLAYAKVPTRAALQEEAQDQSPAGSPYERGGRYTRMRARRLLDRLDGMRNLPVAHTYPVQVWQLGDLTWVALGGEVVVDYALRLKKELGSDTWIAGYSNDVMAYIPSERVLAEGGYEGALSMIVYGHPSPWAPGLENAIVGQARKLVENLRPR